MKLKGEIGDKTYDIEVRRDGKNVSAIINGEPYDAEISQPEPNVFLIKRGGRIFEAYVDPAARSDSPKTVSINGRDIEVKLIDPKRLRGTGAGANHGDGLAEIRTAMPGKIVRILLEVGAAVEKGNGVLVVEAMKMQNELKAPKSGTVSEIRVSEGDTAAAGDVLAIIK